MIISAKPFTLAIYAISDDPTVFMNCLSSFCETVEAPQKIIAIFSSYNSKYNYLWDIEECRHLDIIKSKSPIQEGIMKRFILDSVIETPYLLWVHDDTVVRDENLYQNIRGWHEQEFDTVYITERGAGVSYDRSLGIKRSGPKVKVLDPYLIRHLRLSTRKF